MTKSKSRSKQQRSKYKYTVLRYNPATKERSFGDFHSNRTLAEREAEKLTSQYPAFRFTVASIRIHPDGQQ